MLIAPVGSGVLPDLGSALVVRRQRTSGSGLPPAEGRATVRELARQILTLRNSVARLRLDARVNEAGGGLALGASVTSATSLGLSTQPIPATLTGVEEVNATPTSFGPFGPVFAGASTAGLIVSGVYDGAQGDDTLTFRVKEGGIVGVDKIEIEVRRGTGGKFDTVTFEAEDAPGTVKTVSNGLTLSLSAGVVVKHDTFEVDVFETVGSVVDPDKPFDGTGNDYANFEFGLSVTAGSFFINDTEIAVLASDTLNTVLDRISSSGAGVTATFDSASEGVILTQKTAGADGVIELGSDDTGFFVATKLSGAIPVPGADSELDRALADVPALSGISDGTFSINQVSFTVDTSVDSLNDLIARINAAGAGAIASFDEARGEFRITPQGTGSLELLDGSSGFFTGVKIVEGVYDGGATVSRTGRGSGSQRFARADELPSLLAKFGETLDQLFTTAFRPEVQGLSKLTVEKVEEAVRRVFADLRGAEGDRLRSGLGIDFDFADPSRGVVSVDRGRLAATVRARSDELAEFLLAERGQDGKDGILAALDRALEDSGEDLARLDPNLGRGLILDLLA